ncbi:MAG TPA: sulfite exporter TauE/SafE family protein [Burkholderiales bacterium]|nr:sulfite exporter TauE/SafE family protein [Burkholderiales bacterium]
MDILYTISGFTVGFIVGLTGVGGGSLMTPLLVLVFGIVPATAVGTDLLYAAITKMGGVWVHGRRSNVDWKIVGLLALGSLPASLTTVWVLKRFAAETAQFNSLITSTLGIALILTALVLIFRERLQKFVKHHAGELWHERHPVPATVATGLLLGMLVTISSVGAGALGVAALTFLYPRLTAVKIVGTDIAHAVPLTAVAGLGHMTLGTVDLTLLASLILGSLPGIYLGSHVSTQISEHTLRQVLASMLVLIGGRLVW